MKGSNAMQLSVQGFEEPITWHKTRKLARAVGQLTKTGALSKDYGLSKTQQAATSVMWGAAEGFEK